MNNQELLQLFRKINQYDNCFDREIALRALTKQYKRSDFYKQTKYSINKAYSLFCLNGLNTVAALFASETFTDLARGNSLGLQAKLEEFVEGFDFSVFDTMLTRIGEYITNTQFDVGTLRNEFSTILKEFQSSIK